MNNMCYCVLCESILTTDEELGRQVCNECTDDVLEGCNYDEDDSYEQEEFLI